MANDCKGKINFYKINVETNQELSALFGVRGVPLMVLVSKDIEPVVIPSIPDKDNLVELINDILNKDINDN